MYKIVAENKDYPAPCKHPFLSDPKWSDFKKALNDMDSDIKKSAEIEKVLLESEKEFDVAIIKEVIDATLKKIPDVQTPADFIEYFDGYEQTMIQKKLEL
jgi:hypothetical protein